MEIVLALLVVYGFNFTFWGTTGLVRLLFEKIHVLKTKNKRKPNTKVRIAKVASITPAHNEEKVIAQTLEPLLKFLPKENIFVVSDGSTDKTAEIARSYGAQVVEFMPGNGKAGALTKGIAHFSLLDKFDALIFVDADTFLPKDYLKKALPFFNDPEVVAVAGYARTIWEKEKLNFIQKFFISHRERVYTIIQLFFKYGQTTRHLNVTPIVPGFASIYLTRVLSQIDINAPGLVIEDYNMTFEVHHKRLGRVAHHPSVSGYTQDPDNFRDYFKQIKRWNLGFWQTVRRHGFWPGFFWAALLPYILEVTFGSIIFIFLPFLLLVKLLPFLTGEFIFVLPGFLQFFELVDRYISVRNIFFGILLPDYALTLVIGFIQGRYQYIWYGLGFPFLRFFDAVSFLYTFPKGLLTKSAGAWASPTRR